ncbi:hypothetical protein H8D79_00850 [PVC group bacterium]|nr:hypothetical protein [PVC group bacterium]
MLVEERSEKRREHRRKHESSRREHEEHSEKRPRLVVSLLYRFWFELLALGFLSLGMLLLLEQLEIKAMMFQALMVCVGVVGSGVSALWNLLASIKTSNLVGLAFILAALCMVAYRVRQRAIHRHQNLPPEKLCPECDRDLDRMHRRLIDRLVELMLHIDIRRYSCGKCSFRASVWQLRGESE